MRRLSLGLMLLGTALAVSWQGEVIYQVMPDRFFDGNANNNSDVDKSNIRAWHGGDLAGLQAKLPYVASLGATALWLTPIYQQTSGNSFDTAPYHGYWVNDFTAIDPHFGTITEWQSFLATARDLKFKIMLDQVINHTGYTAQLPEQKPEWFHDKNTCSTLGNPEVYCPLAGLPDLATEKSEVVDFLKQNNAFWAKDVQGFRYDAIKHVNPEIIQTLAVQDKQNNIFTLGEVFSGDVDALVKVQQLGIDSVFDFPMRDAMYKSIMLGQSLDAVRNVLSKDSLYPNPQNLAIFLDNHDVPRFAQGQLFEPEGVKRTQYGIRALMTLRGIPVLYYGTEIAMRGGADPENRRDMRFEGLSEGEKATLEVTKKAIQVRQSSLALRFGNTTVLGVPAGVSEQLLLFTREYQGKKVLVAWHNGRERQTYSIKMNINQSLVQDAFGEDAKMSASNGYLHLSLPARSAAAFAL